jgi:single-strand DNA-binding protein
LNGPQITVVGNVGTPPKLRSLAGGTLVADFRVAMTPSRFDKTSEAWVDQETLWFDVSCWRHVAEHAAMSFHTGDKVIVTGRLSVRSWKDKEDQPRVSMEIDASSVGMDLTRGPVVQRRLERVNADPATGEVVPEQPAVDQVAA